MNLYESGEMYLEAILVLQKKKGTVHSVDIAEYLGYSKPSVSRAMGLLRQGEMITMARDGSLELTEAGRNVADKIYERHVVITSALVSLGIPEDIAAEDACKIEHDISDVSFDAIKAHLQRQKGADA